MKKFMMTLLAVAATASADLVAPDGINVPAIANSTYAYDFSADIKRIEPTFKKQEVNGYADIPTFKYDVVTDTLKGYLLLPRCSECVGKNIGTDIKFAARPETKTQKTLMFLVREGDELAKETKYIGADGKETTYKWVLALDDVLFRGAIFGAYTATYNTKDKDGNYIYSYKLPINGDWDQVDQAWLGLDMNLWKYDKDAEDDAATAGAAIELTDKRYIKPVFSGDSLEFVAFTGKFDGTDPVDATGKAVTDVTTFGFLGVTNVDTALLLDGFGETTVITNSTTTTTAGSMCEPGTEITTVNSCIAIKNIKGTLAGEANYDGICGAIPMWTICQSDFGSKDHARAFAYVAAVCGEWEVEFNEDLSALSDIEKIKWILNDFGATVDDIVNEKTRETIKNALK